MKERRYKKLYRIVTDVDPRTGRPREVAQYAGDYMRFPARSPAPRRRALATGLFVGLYWLFALACLRTARVTGHCMYALVPFMAGLLPGAYGAMGLYALFNAPERMTVVQVENGPGRLVRACLGCGALSAAGAVGGAVFLTRSGRWTEGWHEPLLAALAAVAAWLGFARARRDYRSLEKA